MSGNRTLILGILAIRSSFERDREERIAGRSEAVPDTVQWWIGPERTWRLRTFALDRVLHASSFEARPAIAHNIARQVLERSYGTVLARTFELEFEDPTDAASSASTLHAAGLGGTLEIMAIGFGYWTPDGIACRTWTPPA